MKVDVRRKTVILWLLALAVLLAALLILALQVNRAGYGNLLIGVPNALGTARLSAEKLDEFAEEEFLLTYELRSPVMAEAIHSQHAAVMVGTNHNYANIQGYVLLDGGFFTKAAMDAKSKHVVLNETAAFRMFGSNRITGSTLRIGGEVWIIAGVVQDNDEDNANLYAPATVIGGQPEAVMVLLDSTITEAYAKNALKSVGIRDSGYDFVNLAKSAAAFGERFTVAWQAAVLAALLILLIEAGGKLMAAIRFYRDRIRELYLREVMARYRAATAKTVCVMAAFIAGIVAAMRLSLRILYTCLTWQEVAIVTGELAAGDFAQKLVWLRDWQTVDCILFWLCIGTIAAGFAAVLLRRVSA